MGQVERERHRHQTMLWRLPFKIDCCGFGRSRSGIGQCFVEAGL
jgi:hypothetical protein